MHGESMATIQVAIPEGSDVRIYYDDVAANGVITRTLAMRFANGGMFTGEVTNSRRILIEESK